MLKIVAKYLSLLFLVFGLSACISEFTVTKVLWPAEPVAVNEVTSLHFEFTSVEDNSAENTRVILLQVPRDWIVVAAYLYPSWRARTIGEAASAQADGFALPALSLPNNVQAEVVAGEAMQLLAFERTSAPHSALTNYVDFAGSRPLAGDLLFILPQDINDATHLAQSQKIKVWLGNINENNQFVPGWPNIAAAEGMSALPDLSATYENSLQASGETLSATSGVQVLLPGVPETFADDLTNPAESYWHLPALPELKNRYAYRLFFGQQTEINNAQPLPLLAGIANKAIFSYPDQQADVVQLGIDYAALDANSSYYLDVPVKPGRALGVVFIDGNNRLTSSDQATLLLPWKYLAGLPLVSQVSATTAVSLDESFAIFTPKITVQGTLSLTQPVSIDVSVIVTVAYQAATEAEGAIINRLTQLISIPAGASSADYALSFYNNLPDAQMKIGVSAYCDSIQCAEQMRLLNWMTYYHPNGSVSSSDQQAYLLVTAKQDRTFSGINLQPNSLELAQLADLGAGVMAQAAISGGLYSSDNAKTLLWHQGGSNITERGDQVIWGYYSANPADYAWAHADNPELFVKIWKDVSGRIDVNYCHASGQNLRVDAYLPDTQTYFSSAYSYDLLSQRYFSYTQYPNGEGGYIWGFGDYVMPYSVDLDASVDSMAFTASALMHAPEGDLSLMDRQIAHAQTAANEDFVWGFYHADPNAVSWGNADNPEVFYKFWYRPNGVIDANFCFMSVPDVELSLGLQTLEGVALTDEQSTSVGLSRRFAGYSYQTAVRAE